MERTFQFDSNRELQILCGRYDENLRLIESEMDVVITQKSSGLNISGKRQQVDKTVELFDYLRGMIAEGSEIKKRDISYAVRLAQPDEGIDFKKLAKERIDVTVKGKLVTPKSKGQMEYVEAIKHNDIVFGMGPAGTGKTYLAMAMAVNAFKVWSDALS